MGWPKGKPRGPQNPAHKARRGAAISQGQKRRFADPAARAKMADATKMLWEFGGRYADRTESRMRRMTVTFSEENWAYLHIMARDYECTVAELIQTAISDDRRRVERCLEEDGATPAWKEKPSDTLPRAQETEP